MRLVVHQQKRLACVGLEKWLAEALRWAGTAIGDGEEA